MDEGSETQLKAQELIRELFLGGFSVSSVGSYLVFFKIGSEQSEQKRASQKELVMNID